MQIERFLLIFKPQIQNQTILKNHKLSNEEILLGIKSGDDSVAEYVYKRYFPQIQSYIIKNSGNPQIAKDIFQEAYISLHLKCRKENICLKCEFGTYFYSFCKNLWYKELDRKKRHRSKLNVVKEKEEEYGMLEKDIHQTEEYRIYLDHFAMLVKKCQELLRYYFNRMSFDEIASRMKYENANQARKRKHKCLQQLLESIRSDIRYIDIKGGYHGI